MQRIITWLKVHHEPLILSLFVFFGFFYGLGSYALENVNEGLYGQIPREMLATHQWIIPHLNGVPYLEKPPLLYWLTALSYWCFGISAFSARLVPALSAATVCLTIYQFCHRQKIQAGFLATLMLATSVAFILIARVIIFDMLLCACLTIALLKSYEWYESGDKTSLRIAYLALALAVLTKGLLPLVLAAGIVGTFLLWQRKSWSQFWQFFDPIGLGLFFAISVPWHLLAALTMPEFAWQYFVNEHVLRFLNLRIPNDYHHGPWYFYLPRLFIYIAPWSLFLPALFLKQHKQKALQAFLWLWFLIPLVFFSLSQAKGDYYMVIALPALVLLLAIKLNGAIHDKKAKYLYRLYAITTTIECTLAYLLTLGAYRSTLVNFLPEKLILEPFLARPLLIVSLTVTLLSILGCYLGYRYRQQAKVQYLLIASLMLAPIQFLIVDKQKFQETNSMVAFAHIIQQSPLPIYLYRDFEELSSIRFYTQQRIKLIDSISSDLYFGQHTPYGKDWFLTSKDFKNLAVGPVYIVSKIGSLPYLIKAIAPIKTTIIRQSKKAVLVKADV